MNTNNTSYVNTSNQAIKQKNELKYGTVADSDQQMVHDEH